ncbi:hypothetical protein [Conexibacter sp. DBS9H8]|uniref:hypothetical protein n=1 Tax=Conexibacter sp. DBS9H8 TaxID=2937801 RepID=UPI00200FBA91|nr:hypothetical protein [Conexibacter sp. DBS9H8]
MLAGVARWKWGALLVAAILLILAIVATGSSSVAIANVNGTPITLAAYRAWLSTEVASLHASDTAIPPFVPDPPSYARCIAYVDGHRSSGAKALTHNQAKLTCSTLRAVLAEDVITMLVSSQWYLQQAAREHITISAAAVDKAVHGSFPKASALLHYLDTEKMTQAQLRYEARAGLAADKLAARHSGPTPTISAAQIAAYYSANRTSFPKESLTQATPVIRATLIQSAQAPALDKYLGTVQKYFLVRTTCAHGYRIAGYCHA